MFYSNGSLKALINTSINSDISGFLIVEPIKFNDSFALSLTFGWVSDNVSESLLTICGKKTLNYFGEQ